MFWHYSNEIKAIDSAKDNDLYSDQSGVVIIELEIDKYDEI
jgi:hypothetical protein